MKERDCGGVSGDLLKQEVMSPLGALELLLKPNHVNLSFIRELQRIHYQKLSRRSEQSESWSGSARRGKEKNF